MASSYYKNSDSDLLNSNMEHISNELGALLVCAEGESEPRRGLASLAPHSHGHSSLLAASEVQTAGRKIMPAQANYPHNRSRQVLSAPISSYIPCAPYVFLNATPNAFACTSVFPLQPPFSPANATGLRGFVPLSAPELANPYINKPKPFCVNNSQGDEMALLSKAVLFGDAEVHSVHGHGPCTMNAAYRILQHSLAECKERADYERIMDLSILHWFGETQGNNTVARLFRQFCEMNYFLNDVIPYAHSGAVQDETPMFLRLIETAMPTTKNVQYHVKQVARKCTMFLCDMLRIVNDNKLYDMEKYSECDRSLNTVRKLLSQLELYKCVPLEHRHGKFITEESRAQAARLEALLIQMNDQLRESHVFVHVFNWSVKKFKQQLPLLYRQPYLSQQRETKKPVKCANRSMLTIATACATNGGDDHNENNNNNNNNNNAGNHRHANGVNGQNIRAMTSKRQPIRFIG